MDGWRPGPSPTPASPAGDSGRSPFEKLKRGGGQGVLAHLNEAPGRKSAELSTAPTISITKEEADVMAAAAAAAAAAISALKGRRPARPSVHEVQRDFTPLNRTLELKPSVSGETRRRPSFPVSSARGCECTTADYGTALRRLGWAPSAGPLGVPV